jgi:uncharacterized protein
VRSLLLGLLGGYKRYLSPALSPSCRFVPTCSDYAAEAITRHGAFFGLMLAARRILRCNPFSRGGLDLVPATLFRGQELLQHKFQSQAAGGSQVEHHARTCSQR